MKLKGRPHRNLRDIPNALETNLKHYDDSLLELDGRRIEQQLLVVEGANDAETIQNLLNCVNTLIAALNGSDLTEDS